MHLSDHAQCRATPTLTAVTCTHNPPLPQLMNVLARVAESIAASGGTAVQYLVVDNGSSPRLLAHPCIREFAASHSYMNIVEESRIGISFARRKAATTVRSEYVAFFDDDNLPDTDYLAATSALLAAHPRVAAWGPGTVAVVFSPPSHAWGARQRDLFQERHVCGVVTTTDPSNFERIPYGTGLVVRADVLRDYAERVLSGEYSMTGRAGRRLSSGEDLQLVYHALKLGFSLGLSSRLRLTHVIDGVKTRPWHILRLAYGVNSCYPRAYNEVFSDNPILFSRVPSGQLIRRLWWTWKGRSAGTGWDVLLALVRNVAAAAAIYEAYPEKLPPTLLRVMRRMFLR
jgi:glycosyltransferase involved in cell wall biosynthesis